MNLPDVIAELVVAQNNHNSVAYVQCFSETAVVFDEYEIHAGKEAIKKWIERANHKYKTMMKPVAYIKSGTSIILDVEVTRNFDENPQMLGYHFKLAGGKIHSLLVTNSN